MKGHIVCYHYSETLARRTALAALLLILMSTFSPTRTLAMELKIVGNQIILSGPVVGDEPGKVREALASSPGIDTVILRNSRAVRLSGRCAASRAQFTHGGVGLLLLLVLAHVSRR